MAKSHLYRFFNLQAENKDVSINLNLILLDENELDQVSDLWKFAIQT